VRKAFIRTPFLFPPISSHSLSFKKIKRGKQKERGVGMTTLGWKERGVGMAPLGWSSSQK
jgi:hypothetical protein